MPQPLHRHSFGDAPSPTASQQRREALIDEIASRWHLSPVYVAELRQVLLGETLQAVEPADTWVEGHSSAPSRQPTEMGISTLQPQGSDRSGVIDDRYELLGTIGTGGMGEVRRVRDRKLHRVLAMKVIREEYKNHPRALARFLEEAQISAQLDHPGIVPVHDLGRLRDGRVYFTMQEVQGETLGGVLRAVHRAATTDRWERTESGWTFRRLIESFHRVCEAVAYAHARGVLHRDLKPANIMLGTFGEVLVMDWGLAKVVGSEEPAPGPGPVQVDLTAGTTRSGTVAGTPAYMPPEQARGDLDQLDTRADVYALGAILYEILDGAPPYRGRDALDDVLAGPPRPLAAHAHGRRATAGPQIPPPLVEICAHAMARTPCDRFDDARALANALGSWLEGDRRRGLALSFVAKADAIEPEVQRLRTEASHLREEATGHLRALREQASASDKREAWRAQDEAAELELQAELLNVEVLQHLRAALAEAPDTREAHARLACHYQVRHLNAVARRDRRGQAALEALLRAHDTGVWVDYLEGEGRVSVRTCPAAHAELLRVVERDRRLVAVRERVLGPTPLRRIPLPHGSWIVALTTHSGMTVRYPVYLARQEAWHGTPLDADQPHVIAIPDVLGSDERYVPAGPAWLGGDRSAPGSGARRQQWIAGFISRKEPVSHAAYLTFLDALQRRGAHREALRYAPRHDGFDPEGLDGLLYPWRDGRLTLPDGLDSTVPVTQIDWHGARAYAAWWSEHTGQPWRLPTEQEWEKCARGVDGRFHPWGDHFDPDFCRHRTPHNTTPRPDPTAAWPLDESPYGVLGLAGNVRQWCLNLYAEPQEAPDLSHEEAAHDSARTAATDAHTARSLRATPEGAANAPRHAPSEHTVPREEGAALGRSPETVRSVRGGSWTRDARWSRAAARDWELARSRQPDLGFRLVRTWPD